MATDKIISEEQRWLDVLISVYKIKKKSNLIIKMKCFELDSNHHTLV